MAQTTAVRLTLRGRVHGVSFRDFAQRQAGHIGLVGYVRNVPDGTVEVVAEGRPSDLLHFIEELMEGPPQARGTAVDTEWLTPTGGFAEFSIRD